MVLRYRLPGPLMVAGNEPDDDGSSVSGEDTPATPAQAPTMRLVGGIFLPAAAIRMLVGMLVVVALGLPWLARSLQLVDVELDRHVGEVRSVQYRPEIVRLPAGRFIMGSPETEDGRFDDETEHEAEVASFEICRTEVTVTQWAAVWNQGLSDFHRSRGDRPMALSWENAVEYLNILSSREDLTPCYREQGGEWAWIRPCDGYRLPTETEWEYAARADTVTSYSFGTDSSLLDTHAWHSGNSSIYAQPVARKLANPWGLYDMYGNVYEWVWDRYGEYPSGRTSEGYAGPDEGDDRVLRGGSFGHSPRILRSAHRHARPPSTKEPVYGFRCARSLRSSADNERAQRKP